jgi:hypothetical protein
MMTDRYEAIGIPEPDVDTMCQGECEGTGWYPTCDVNDPLWQEAHAKPHSDPCDGWHFVQCPACGGTGTRR